MPRRSTERYSKRYYRRTHPDGLSRRRDTGHRLTNRQLSAARPRPTLDLTCWRWHQGADLAA